MFMNSRMEKYESSNNKATTRSIKNKNLYEEIDRIDVGYIDINDANVFEMKPNNKITTREDYKKAKEFAGIVDMPSKEQTTVAVKEKEERIYDINEILKKAKEELKEEKDKKRLLNTEYNILTKLDISNIEKISNTKELKEEEIKNLVEEVYPKKQTIATDDNKDLFADLTENDITREIINKEVKDVKVVTEDKKLEVKDIIDTTSVDQDFIQIEKSNKAVVAIIIIISLLFIGAVAYLLLKYFKYI